MRFRRPRLDLKSASFPETTRWLQSGTGKKSTSTTQVPTNSPTPWLVPNKPHANPPGARLRASSSRPRPRASPPRPPVTHSRPPRPRRRLRSSSQCHDQAGLRELCRDHHRANEQVALSSVSAVAAIHFVLSDLISHTLITHSRLPRGGVHAKISGRP